MVYRSHNWSKSGLLRVLTNMFQAFVSGKNSGGGGSKFLKRQMGGVLFLLLVATAPAAVNVSVQDSNGVAWIKYECTAGEVIRAFALNVTVDKGRIISIGDFHRGPSTAAEPGYGIFPASFRDHVTVGPGTNVDWNVIAYTPLAVVADDPENTLPGLDSAGVTLEFGGLWSPAVPGAVPGSTGTLCSLRISERASVSVAPNPSRGGVLAANPDVILDLQFTGAVVQPPEITGLSLTNGLLSVTFAGGELEIAPAISGPWTGTGNTAGQHSEPIAGGTNKFYRVRGL
ncbi:MAG: hypothetical protein AB8I69_10835 [Anaerolineae bacterium]